MAWDSDKIKKDLGIIANLNPMTRLIKMLMERYRITEEEAIDMIQRGGQGPELEPSKPRQMPEEELPRRFPENWRDVFPDREWPGWPEKPPKMWPEREPDRGWPTDPRDDIPYDFMPRGIEPSFDRKKYYKDLNQGGRVGYQTGGITTQTTLPPEWIEGLVKPYGAELLRQSGLPTVTTADAKQPGETDEQFATRQALAQQFGITQAGMKELKPGVADMDALQQAAYQQATATDFGLGAYQPFVQRADTAAQAAAGLTGTGAGDASTAGTIASYMSPYQQQVIDATMTEFDEQAKMRENQRAAAALGVPGAYGGGREGVQKAEYEATSDRNRAALLAQLSQQGFQQASQARAADFARQQAVAQQASGLGALTQGAVSRQIAGLGTLGATQQAQEQAKLDATRQFAQIAVGEPQQRLGTLGAGITPLLGGTLGTSTMAQAPQTSPLGTALGIGSTLAGIYGMMK